MATYRTSEETVAFPSQSMLKHQQPCSDESRRIEGEQGDFLSWARQYSVRQEEGSNRLTIRSARGKTLTFEQLQPTVEDIADAKWLLVAFIELRELDFGMWFPRTTTAIQGTDLALSFNGDVISGTSGCNSYSASATVGDRSVTIDTQTFFYAELSCKDSKGLMEQEERYLDLLPRLTRYGIHGENLFMYTDDDVFLLFRS